MGHPSCPADDSSVIPDSKSSYQANDTELSTKYTRSCHSCHNSIIVVIPCLYPICSPSSPCIPQSQASVHRFTQSHGVMVLYLSRTDVNLL